MTMLWGSSDKMTALYIAATGHVLGVATHAGTTDAAVEPSILAGARLPLRASGGPVVLGIPATHLASALVDHDPRVLVEPRAYTLQDDALTQSAGTLTAALDGAKLVVTLPNRIVADTPKLVHIESSVLPAPIDENGVIKATLAGNLLNPTPTEFEVELGTVAAGDYWVFVAVSGYRLYFGKLHRDPVEEPPVP
ncbi:hypothetical protein [Haliangium sp.]|uniref:hypothetical protein n=1 Tax=Haliangium sp. TaxID=2663208 RepID=UPI003D152324